MSMKNIIPVVIVAGAFLLGMTDIPLWAGALIIGAALFLGSKIK